MGLFRLMTSHLILIGILIRVVENTGTWDLGTQSQYECLFNTTDSEDNLCQLSEGFSTFPAKAKEWTTSEKSLNPETGPQDSPSGHYAVYNSASSPTGFQTSLNTPTIKTAGNPVCVHFAYYMYGADLGSLYVVEKYIESEFGERTFINPSDPVSNSSDRYARLIAREDQGKRWLTTSYQTATNSQNAMQLLFTAIRGNGDLSDIAIDNVTVKTDISACPTDGNWGPWTTVSPCDTQCGTGSVTRTRTCDSPSPKLGGRLCWKTDFTQGMSEIQNTWCYGKDCSNVIVDCTKNCEITNNQVIQPTLTLDNETLNLEFMISITRDFNDFTLKFDDVTLIKASKSKIDVTSNPSFDFGAAKIIVDGSSYNISFKMINYNWTIHDNKLFKYILKYDGGKTHNGTLKLYSAIDGNWGVWSYGKCSDKCGDGIGRRQRKCGSPAPQRAGQECLKNDWTRGLLEEECRGQCYGGIAGVTVACLSGCSYKDGILIPASVAEEEINIAFKFLLNKDYESFIMMCDGNVCVNVTRNNPLKSNSSVYFNEKKIEQNGTGYEIMLTMLKLNAAVGIERVFEYTLRYNGTVGKGRMLLTTSPKTDDKKTGGGIGVGNVKPVDGKYSNWGAWGQCTVTCGGGQQTRMRKCDNPAQAGSGKPCDGPSSETMACNTQRCPNPYAGVQREVYTPYDKSNLNDFSNVKVDMPAFPNTPTSATLQDEFKHEDTTANQKASLIRYWTYFVAQTTGIHTFYMTCSTLCNLRVSLYECSELKESPIKILKGNYSKSQYKSNETTVEYSMTRKYRYCIQSMHQVTKNTANSWLYVGVTLPKSTKTYYPLSKSQGGVFTAPNHGFTYIEPELVNVTHDKAVVKTYCPDLFYWTYKASVAWVRPQNNSYAPLMGFSYVNGTNINVTDLRAYTVQNMHITCLGEEYAIFLTDFPLFKTKQGPPTKAPVDFNVTLQPPTSFLISWGDIPEDGRSGKITGFQLEYNTMSYDGKKLSDEWQSVELKDPKMRKTKVKFDKEFFKWYAFRIAGMTIAGAGKPTDHIIGQTEDSTPSAPPGSVSFKSPNSTSLRIIWSEIPMAHQNGIITAFNISIKLNGTDEWNEYIVDPSLKQYTFYNLKKWSFYWLTIAGQTRKGQGPSSNENMFRTMEDFPDTAPTALTVSTNSKDQLNVTWSFVGFFKYGTIIGYAISYREEDNPTASWITVKEDAKTNTTMLTDLESYTRYAVKVAARSNAGIGVYSSPVINRTDEAVPTRSPQNFTCFNTSSTSLRCTWLEPTASYASGIVNGYRIFHHVYSCAASELLGTGCNETDWWYNTIPFSSQTFYDFKNLSRFTYYEVQVFLYNRVGNGPRSKGFLVRTDEDIPTGKPQDVLGFPHTISSVQLFFKPLPYGTRRGILTSYVCFYRKINDLDLSKKSKVQFGKSRKRRDVTGYYVDNNIKYTLYDGDHMYPEKVAYIPIYEKTAVINQLDPYQRYTFRLAAQTSKGIGPTVDFRVNTKPGYPINSPNLTVFDRYALDRVRLSWGELSWNNSRGEIMNYYFIYKAVSRGGEEIFHYEYTEDYKWIGANLKQIELTGLTPFTTYDIRLAAVSEKGIGIFSSNPVYASTCNCPAKIHTNYMKVNPYHDISNDVLKKGIVKCCEPCVNSWGKSVIDWTKDLNGDASFKTDYSKFKNSLHEGAHITFPIQYGPKRKIYESFPYVPVLRSSNFLVFGRVGEDAQSMKTLVREAVGNLWPHGFLILAFILLYGIVMWIIQCNPLQLTRNNRDEFPDDFGHGAGAGVWWAVVTMFHVGYGRIFARGVVDRIFSIPAIIFGLVLTILITSSLTVQLTTFYTKRPVKELMNKIVGVPEGSYDRYAVSRQGGWVLNWYASPNDLYKALYDHKIDLIAVDPHYAIAMRKTLLDDSTTKFYGSYDRESSFGVVLSNGVEQLEYCLRDYFKNSGQVEHTTKTLDVYSNNAINELEDQFVTSFGRFSNLNDTKDWLFTIIVCIGLTVVAYICGAIYELRRRGKYARAIQTHKYEEAQRIFLKTGNELVEEFQKECEKKLEEVEVKHAFQRIDLKIHMQKNMKFLSPNDVFKYKL